MGLLDRFKKAPGPDAMTWEAVARLRVVPGVVGAEPVDADTVQIAWADNPYPSTLSLAAAREGWTKANGFDRIEIMDGIINAVAPPTGPPEGGEEPGVDPTPPDVAPDVQVADEAEAGDALAATGSDGTAWEAARDRLRVVVGRTGEHPDAITWPIAGVLEARIVLGGPGALPVDDGDAASWEVGVDDVRAAALANLAASDPGLDPVGPGQPAWVPTSPADHPPAWLAAPDRLLAACGLDQAVVLAPMPTELVVVDPSAHDLLGSILTSTKSIVEGESRLLWPAPLLATPAGLVPWEPAADHPCAGLAAELAASA
ncbi:MAG TPA: hypothetical protein DCS55_16870 [Acidimicrobiaceae bacterium]|nr:hypothetical protein [Acidimicrobiaceae bacterium]